MSFVIWTTTTWTLPGNLAVCLHADFAYRLLQAPGGEQYVIASELAEASMKAAGIADYKELGRVKGAALEGIRCRHPFLGPGFAGDRGWM